MMAALLLYGYSGGVYSSRWLAQACEECVYFMAVTELNKPDFALSAISVDGDREARLEARADHVAWRVAADWQGEVLRQRFRVPAARILKLPARAALSSLDRLGSVRLPPGLPECYLLCLTPVGDAGDLIGLVEAHHSLGDARPLLVVLGIADPAWRPALTQAVDAAGSRGRVLVLGDLDPISEVAAIARAKAVVALDRHPAHAVRLRQAAMPGRPAAVRRHPGHATWVEGGHSDGSGLAAALHAPTALRLRAGDGRSDAPDPLVAPLLAIGPRRLEKGALPWEP